MAQLQFDIMANEADVIKDQNPSATGSTGLYGGAKGIWTGSQAEYDAFDEYDDQIIYFIVGDAEEA